VSGTGGSSSYDVEVSPAASRDLKRLVKQSREQFEGIDQKIASLADDPRPFGSEKLSGSDNIYRIRDGDFRILYAVYDETRRVEIARVRDRKDVYRS